YAGLTQVPREVLEAAQIDGAVVGGLLALGGGWLVGAGPGRTVLAALAVVALGLLVQVADPAGTRWPYPPARRSRPGWHVLAGVQRGMEAARTDRDDRRAVARRLDTLDALGPPGSRDPRTDAARLAVGLPVPSTRRPS
ncbi:hypothetical protein, partial [Aquipuribacter hungaricus]|uniref:hypothetical protein n=1 Tax=Aquipuribacter hungaricus TaxID=545624 RepID=UPI0030EB6011